MNFFCFQSVLLSVNVELLFMKGIVRLLMVLTALYPLGLRAQGIADIALTLRSAGCWQGTAELSVSLPQTDTDVVYTLELMSMATPADTLSPCAYLIDWAYEAPSGLTQGFTAYFDGSLYRLRDSRLQEYHTSWDVNPFISAVPVQRTAQFANLLPQMMGTEIEGMLADERWSLSLTEGKRFDGHQAVEIQSVMTVGGQTAQEKRFILDAATMMPLRTVTEANPGALAEQTITVTYSEAADPNCEPLSEDMLMKRYPEAFEKYRESNFRIENMRGELLPAFALPTTTGERHLHHRGEALARPVVIAIIDPTVGSFNTAMIADIRSAIDQASSPADAILAFATTNADLAEETAGQPRPGETLLLNARSLARDCGAAALPVVIVADSQGVVRNVVLGYNKELADVVLQTLELVTSR